jgi:hypothetical protein
MKAKKHIARAALLLSALMIGLAMSLQLMQPAVGVVQAAEARPTLAPLPTLGARMMGAHIELRAPEAAGLRAVVQWQSGDGAWHDVDGWRSELRGEPVIWWTAPSDFGKGPFRWAAYGDDRVQPRFASESFRLPNNHGDRTIVTMRRLTGLND